jgi:hypothetical protein
VKFFSSWYRFASKRTWDNLTGRQLKITGKFEAGNELKQNVGTFIENARLTEMVTGHWTSTGKKC